MRSSHLSRIEENKAKKRIYISLVAVVVILFALIKWGVPLFTNLSLFIAPSGPSDNNTDNTSSLLLPPRLDPVDEATFSGRISIHGFANAGETVKLYLNDEEYDDTLVGKDDKFTISNIKLEEGENTLYAVASKEKIKSAASDKVIIIYKKEPPKLEVNEPSDNQTFFGDNNTATIRGKTDPDTRVYINERLAIVENDGSFSYSLRLNEGEQTIVIQAIDIAGNKTEVEKKVTFKL